MPPKTPGGPDGLPDGPGAPGTPQRGALRASDDDRERVVAELGDHLAAGRLDTAEFDERASSAYAARTLGELDVLMTDLPAERERAGSGARTSLEKAASPGPAPAARPQDHKALNVRTWLAVSVMVTGVWGISSLAAHQLLNFWPMWVIGPWGLGILFHALSGRRSGPTGEVGD
ncbi:DUF1707 domain-containing protein [Streptomyces sp. RKND-216]|uniref:DUF1707 domain-containing protein n=1 Tax=Streptomyces sp. RKND-216 TaxID=2562581 RepID=UPI00109DD9A1|nr:DUF1707 domain-containing protein [Streptomyces sp. RKND-216]